MAKPTSAVPFTEDEISAAVNISPEAIQEEYARCPGDLQYFRRLLATAKADCERADLTVEQVESALQAEFRAKAAKAKKGEDGYMTVDDVAAAVAGHERRLKAVNVAIEARQSKDTLDGVCEAIRTKREMLVSLGADLREERAATRR